MPVARTVTNTAHVLRSRYFRLWLARGFPRHTLGRSQYREHLPVRVFKITMAPPAASIPKARKPKKLKAKEKVVSPDAEAAVGISIRNEGVDPSLAYAPPAGSVPADYDVEFGEFDYDAVKADEGAELWLVRVPTGVRSQICAHLRMRPLTS